MSFFLCLVHMFLFIYNLDFFCFVCLSKARISSLSYSLVIIITYICDYYSSLSIYVDMWIWVGMKMHVYYIMIYVPWKPSVAGARFFLSPVRSGLGLCSAGRRPGYWSNLLVPEVTCPVTGRARPGVAPGRRRGTGPGAIGCPACATETGQHRRGSVAMTFCRPLDRRTTTGLVYPYRCSKSVNRPVVANHKADDGRHDAA